MSDHPTSTSDSQANPLLDEFLCAMYDAGLSPNGTRIVADGRVHKFKGPNDKKAASWYQFTGNYGAFGSFRDDTKFGWTTAAPLSRADKKKLEQDVKAAQAEADAERKKLQAAAAKKAGEIWTKQTRPIEDPHDHSYLNSKQILAHKIRRFRFGNTLCIPMFDAATDEAVNLQSIDLIRGKRFLQNGRVTGTYYPINDFNSNPSDSKTKQILVCEGFATGASLHESTHIPTAVVFTAGNLLPVAKALRKKNRRIEIIICADDDRNTDGNPGRTKARAAAANIKAKLAIPEFPATDTESTDFNDLAVTVGRDAVKQQIDEAIKSNRLLSLPADAPGIIADAFVAEYFSAGEIPTLRYWAISFWRWTGCYYALVNDKETWAWLGKLFENVALFALCGKEVKEVKEVPVTPKHISDTLDMLKARAWLATDEINAPTFLDDRETPPHLIAVRNGLLNLATGEMQDATPAFFNLTSLAVDYDELATCPRWGEFLWQIFQDGESIDTLQEMFGYLIEDCNEQEKVLGIAGPTRSGKSTIARMVKRLLGDSVAAPTLKDLTDQFGPEQLIGKSVAIISDARIGRNTDAAVAIERLLSISGRDHSSVQRKNKLAFTKGLDTRFLILANMLPALSDPSGAYANRFIVLETLVSFLGREDPQLFERDLAPEASGVLNWAIEGWRRLQERGYFQMPEASAALFEELKHLTNPFAGFIDDRLQLLAETEMHQDRYPEGLVDKSVVYDVYVRWCQARDKKAKGEDWFFRDLKACGINTRFRWDPLTRTTRTIDHKQAQLWVRGVKIK